MCDLVEPDMLREIAESDYGWFAQECLEALQAMVSSRKTLDSTKFYGREMLELIRWSEPDSPSRSDERTGTPGHVMRAFCCAGILNVDSIRGWSTGNEEATIVHLTQSIRAIGDPASEAGAKFFAHELGRRNARDDVYEYLAMALANLALCHFKSGPEVAMAISEWMIEINESQPALEETNDSHASMTPATWCRLLDELVGGFPLPGIVAMANRLRRSLVQEWSD
jgi:hypothetical protein